MFLLSTLNEDSGSDLGWVGWWREIADLPGLIVDGLNNDKVMPVNLKITNKNIKLFFLNFNNNHFNSIPARKQPSLSQELLLVSS